MSYCLSVTSFIMIDFECQAILSYLAVRGPTVHKYEGFHPVPKVFSPKVSSSRRDKVTVPHAIKEATLI